MSRFIRAAALLAAALLSSRPAVAHPLLLESSPTANAVVAAPHRVELRFNNRIETSLSRVRLVDDRGGRRDLAVTPAASPDRLTATLPPLAPGRYQVEWQVLSTDGHIVNGRFAFRVTP